MLNVKRANLETIESADIYWFEDEFGITIDLNARILGTYQRTKTGLAGPTSWTRIDFSFDDIRQIEEQIGQARSFEASGLYSHTVQGGMNRLGDTLGAVGRNAREKAKARKHNGIVFTLRSSELPRYFLRVVDDKDRRELREVLRQVEEGRTPDRVKRKLPEAIGREIYALIDAARKQNAERLDARASFVKRLIFGTMGALAALVIIFIGTVQVAKFSYKRALLSGYPIAEAEGLRCQLLSMGKDFGADGNSIALEDFEVSGDIKALPEEIRSRLTLAPTLEFARGDYLTGPTEWRGVWLVGIPGSVGSPKTPAGPNGLPIRRLETPKCG